MDTGVMMGNAKSDDFDLHSMPEWIEVDHSMPSRGVWTHPDLPVDTLLYRYMPLQWALAAFGAKAFLMRQPRLWDDPYERWWSDQLFKTGSKLADAHAFGSCWTTRYIDEPIWRIYMCPHHPEVPAIRISTRAGKLCARMKELCRTETGKAFLGRVRYTPKDRLPALAAELTGDPDNHLARTAARGLHWKRSQFQLEQEVRLLWIMTNATAPDVFQLSFEWNELIEQVRIGPTINEKSADNAYDALVRVGVAENLIKYSTIYRAPGAPPRRRTSL